jgi:tetratricopeptide (TPR) repeat protein
MDDASYGVEQKLISFHLGVAILAQRIHSEEQFGEAERLFLEASDWDKNDTSQRLKEVHDKLGVDDTEPGGGKTKEAIQRIMAEANYNLGVVYELQRKWPKPIRAYKEATHLAEEDEDPKLVPVSILSRFGEISAQAELGYSSAVQPNIKALGTILDKWEGETQSSPGATKEDEAKKKSYVGERIDKVKKVLRKAINSVKELLGRGSAHRARTEALSPSQASQFRMTIVEIRERLFDIDATQNQEAESKAKSATEGA